MAKMDTSKVDEAEFVTRWGVEFLADVRTGEAVSAERFEKRMASLLAWAPKPAVGTLSRQQMKDLRLIFKQMANAAGKVDEMALFKVVGSHTRTRARAHTNTHKHARTHTHQHTRACAREGCACHGLSCVARAAVLEQYLRL
jgi:hypothetical protein